ncbi:MAG: acetylglutamate kinase [Clostridioides sp.]|jgi:acetylglutamate kinase|nr:acetylglutamate kinase [Clostridioides sp.]
MINIEKANTLVEALPYIKRHNGKTMVVKYGGSAMKNKGIKDSVIEDLLLMSYVGINIVLVHGGGPEITQMLEKLNIKTSFVEGLRYTDEETMEIVQMVLAGKINKSLVAKINTFGGKAIGLCGVDNNMIKCSPYKNFKLGYVGEIEEVNSEIIEDSLKAGYISVIATIGVGENGETYNVNGDIAASEIAKKLKADKLILLTDVPGILIQADDDNTLIPELHEKDVEELMDNGIITGGMIPKINGCIDALNSGVNRIHILDGRIPHSIITELFTDSGIGTLICKENEGSDKYKGVVDRIENLKNETH